MGAGLDQAVSTDMLDACLVAMPSGGTFDPSWSSLPDPFPKWQRRAA